MAAVASSQRAVCAALRTTAVQQHRSVAAAPAPARQAAVFAPKRSLALRARRASTVAVQASGAGLPIDLRGERRGGRAPGRLGCRRWDPIANKAPAAAAARP